MRVGIIGIGKLGSIHLRIYREIVDVKHICIVDCNIAKLAAHPNIESFTDYRNLLGKVDLISIAAPTLNHFEIAQFFL
ncbi:MAG: Gfo/Idh/MocA family oxidoreductase, partial [Candidatus Omnitrophica bacterium]|nr:Gfo/Idh/MocA family oxidoreductase [Candidatus Omnitrophota bacterium]